MKLLCMLRIIPTNVANQVISPPWNIRSKAFDPFFTTREMSKGTGQGLATAYDAVVDRSGSSITFETGAAKGTTFFIRLPVVPERD